MWRQSNNFINAFEIFSSTQALQCVKWIVQKTICSKKLCDANQIVKRFQKKIREVVNDQFTKKFKKWLKKRLKWGGMGQNGRAARPIRDLFSNHYPATIIFLSFFREFFLQTYKTRICDTFAPQFTCFYHIHDIIFKQWKTAAYTLCFDAWFYLWCLILSNIDLFIS